MRSPPHLKEKKTTPAAKTTEPKAPEPPADATATEKWAKADVREYAKKLLKDYQGNAVAADNKYKDRTVGVVGEVQKVDTLKGKPVVVLKGAAVEFDIVLEHVLCVCDNADRDKLAELADGHWVALVGRCTGKGSAGGIELGSSIMLQGCNVVHITRSEAEMQKAFQQRSESLAGPAGGADNRVMSRLVRIAIGTLAVGLAGLAAYWLLAADRHRSHPAGPTVVWVFEAPRAGGIVAAPWVADDAIYVSAFHPHGFRMTGAVYALDPATGKRRWTFDAGGRMLATASAPVLADGRLYVGEGMHGHFACHLYCLDPTTGKQTWAVETTDHVESTATVADGAVYFGAGNDGVYAVDAATGQERWRFSGDLHVDAQPAVSHGRVIVGSGPSRLYKTLRVVSLDAKTGGVVWRADTDLPAWGSPRAAGGRVFVGLGNGRLMEGAKPPETPRGAVLCLDEATGERALARSMRRTRSSSSRRWTATASTSARATGTCMCVKADDGQLVYRVPMGGPVIAPPTVADGKVYAVTVGGKLRCLDAADGRELWGWDLKARVKFEPLVFGAVRVSGGRVYVAAEIQTGAGGSACLYCLEP